VSPEAIAVLKNQPVEDLAAFGIEVVKQIIAEKIKVRVCGSVWNVMTKGYLGVIQAAGPEFLKFLASQGLTGISKIMALIKTLKS
jgi:hypothetical protein